MALPRAGKRFKDLLIPGESQQRAKAKSSYHTVLEAIKTKKGANKTTYFLKLPESTEVPVSAFEAACADLFRLMDLDIAPNTRAYYEDDHLKGVASKKFANFKSNKDDPLKRENLSIADTDLLGSEVERENFKSHLKDLSEILNREATSQDGYLTSSIKFIANTVNRTTSSMTAVSVRTVIDKFINGEKKLDKSTIEEKLLPILNKRAEVIKDRKVADKYKEEDVFLVAVIGKAKELLNSKPKISTEFIEQMEGFCEEYAGVLEELNPDYIVSNESADYLIKITDLKNYVILKGLASGLTSSYIFQEGDCHNRNIAKDGRRIDFDMTFWWNISYNWKEDNMLKSLSRSPAVSPFSISERDIINFPNVVDATFFYWPTQSTTVSESVVNKISEELKYRLSPNFFSTKDNTIFQLLGSHPIFNFHKYKNFVKFITMPDEMFAEVIKLHVPDDAVFISKSSGQPEDLSEAMLKNIAAQKNALEKVLLDIPEFKTFWSEHKSLIKKMILKESGRYSEKYSNKPAGKKEIFAGLVKAMNIDLIASSIDALDRKMEPCHAVIQGDHSQIASVAEITDEYTPANFTPS